MTQTDWKKLSILGYIEKRIAIYSPHTTWNSIDSGFNDWGLKLFGVIHLI